MSLKKGQSILEQVVLLCVVVSALLIMQVYFKRAHQGRIKQDADSIGQQYSPKHTTSLTTSRTVTNTASYTGGITKAADLPGLVPDNVLVGDGMTVTFSGSSTTTDRKEAVDAFAAEN